MNDKIFWLYSSSRNNVCLAFASFVHINKRFLYFQGIDTEADILQANLLTLVLGLLEDPAKKEYFFQVSVCHIIKLD